MTGKIGLALLVLWVAAAAVPALGRAAPGDDGYIEGYAAALLEREFKIVAPSLRVQNGVITLAAADLAGVDRARVIAALEQIRGVARVEVREAPAPPPTATSPAAPPPPKVLEQYEVGALPGGLLFKPLIADPRWPHFAATYQSFQNDRQLHDVAAVSFGETFALYRERIGHGWWDLGIQAGVFAIFDLNAPSKDLINADYLVALPVGYRYEQFSGFLRVFHQSSHLGDEFVLRSRERNRLNLSYEGVDAKLSYELGDVLRIYGGGGYLFDRDPVSLQPWSTQVGVEVRSPWPGPGASWRPIAGLDLQNREENDWATDLSLRVGVQFDGLPVSRKLQILLEYFHGHSPNGQFFRQKLDYIGIGTHFHF